MKILVFWSLLYLGCTNPALAEGVDCQGLYQAGRFLNRALKFARGHAEAPKPMAIIAKVVEAAPVQVAKPLTEGISILKKFNTSKFDVGIGDELSLKMRDGRRAQGRFLGLRDGKILLMASDKEEVGVYPVGELSGNWTSALRMQPLTKVREQESNDCAVHSNFNAIRTLYHYGLLKDDLTRQLASKNQDQLFQILTQTVGAQSYAERVGKSGFFGRVTTPNQIQQMMAVLPAYGVPAKRTSALPVIRDHLEAGNPVVLNLNVTLSDAPEASFARAEARGQPAGAMIPDKASPYGHSVLAVGYVRGTDGTKDKIVVSDSHTGGYELWDAEAVENASRENGDILINDSSGGAPGSKPLVYDQKPEEEKNPFFRVNHLEPSKDLQWVALKVLSESPDASPSLRAIALDKIKYFQAPSKPNVLPPIRTSEDAFNYAAQYALSTFRSPQFDKSFREELLKGLGQESTATPDTLSFLEKVFTTRLTTADEAERIQTRELIAVLKKRRPGNPLD